MPTFVRTEKCDGCKGQDKTACMYICPHDLMLLDILASADWKLAGARGEAMLAFGANGPRFVELLYDQLDRVLRAFETSVARLLPQLEAARTSGDRAGIRHVAHTLKSSSASIGKIAAAG